MTGSSSRAPSRARRRGWRGRKVVVFALTIEAVCVVPQVVIVATLGVDAGRGLMWPLWFPMLVLSLFVSLLALVILVVAARDTAAGRITGVPAARRIVGAAALAHLAPLSIFVVPLLALVGLGHP